MVAAFNITRIPRIVFGAGSLARLPAFLKEFGNSFLIVTGESSFNSGSYGIKFFNTLLSEGFTIYISTINREPSPADIDTIVSEHFKKKTDAVIGIGGGSVLDTAKAVSAMLKSGEPVKDYIEGVGTKVHPGIKIPFIAVPTTAGTGSETTENAVICEIGANGFKRSLRHPALMPDMALVDPELTLSCPPEITAASGLDALTQSVEAYLSVKANTFTDSLAPEAIKLIIGNLPRVFKNGNDIEARAAVAYGAMVSGILLANAGLGLVHGFASSVGGLIEIPHGVLCGTLLGAANSHILSKLVSEDNKSIYIHKYAQLGRITNPGVQTDDIDTARSFAANLEGLVEELRLPRLGRYGLTANQLEKVVEKTGQKNNPVMLNKQELLSVLKSRL